MLRDVSDHDFVYKKKVLQEEGLNGRKDSTGTSLILKDAVFDLVVKVKALAPRVVEISLLASEQQLLNALLFLQRDAL